MAEANWACRLNSEMLGYNTYVIELAPSGRRPTYVGLFNTIKGALILLPAIGGLLLAAASYGVLFAVTAVMLVAALALSWSLPSLRRAALEAQVEPIV